MLTQRGISISDESRLPPKVRAFIVDKDLGRPLSGIVIALVAEPDDRIFLPLGILVSDAAGYVSFDLKSLRELHVSPPKHLWLYATGDETSKIDLPLDRRGETTTVSSEAAQSGAPNPLAKFCFPFLLKVNAKLAAHDNSSINLPSIQNPDLGDWELSPYSFATKSDLTLGEPGCEVLVPSTVAERQYKFTQVVRTAIPDPSLSIGYAVENTQTGYTAKNISIKPLQLFEIDLPSKMTIAYGEVLEFKQTWTPMGHALGTILYSLALAPCESVNIAVIEWSRKDEITRTDTIVSKEGLYHSQRRDRTIDDGIDAVIKESQGGSAFMGGMGGAFSAGIPLEAGLFSSAYASGYDNA